MATGRNAAEEDADPGGRSRAGRPTAAAAATLEARILDAAWQVVLVFGADMFSVDQVAQQARTSKRTIYTRFGSKAALVRRMVDRGVTDYLAALRQRFDENGLQAMLEAHATIAFRYMSSAEGKALNRLIDKHGQGAEPGGNSIDRNSHRIACAGVEDMLAEAARRGEVHVDDAAFAAAFWVESLVGHARVGHDAIDQIDDWARRHVAMFLRALRP